MKFFRATCVEFKRSIKSVSFVLQILLLFAMMCLNNIEVFSGTHKHEGLLSTISIGLTGSYFSYLLLLLGTISYGWSYCADHNCGFEKEAVTRVGPSRYGVGKHVATVCSSILAASFSILLFVLFQLARGVGMDDIMSGNEYLELVKSHGIGPYLCCRVIVTGLSCGFAAALALVVSAYCRNIYLSMLAPLMFYLTMMSVFRLNLIPIPELNPDTILFGRVYEEPMKAFWWAIGYLSILILLCGFCFEKRIRREYYE